MGCSVHWRPLHLHPYYQETFGWRPEDLPVATAEWERLVSLPIFPDMREDEVDAVVERVAAVQGAPVRRRRTAAERLEVTQPEEHRRGPRPGLPRPVEVLLALARAVRRGPDPAAAAVGDRADLGGPVLFRQTRVGRGGQPFTLVKLRTMRSAPGPAVTARDDARVTPSAGFCAVPSSTSCRSSGTC